MTIYSFIWSFFLYYRMCIIVGFRILQNRYITSRKYMSRGSWLDTQCMPFILAWKVKLILAHDMNLNQSQSSSINKYVKILKNYSWCSLTPSAGYRWNEKTKCQDIYLLNCVLLSKFSKYHSQYWSQRKIS